MPLGPLRRLGLASLGWGLGLASGLASLGLMLSAVGLFDRQLVCPKQWRVGVGVRALVALCLVIPPSIAGSAFAEQDDLTCGDFQHNPDGSWTPLQAMTIAAPNGRLRPAWALRLLQAFPFWVSP